MTPAWADGHEHEGHRREHGGHSKSESALKEIHEFIAYLTLMLVLLHVGGVALASLSHQRSAPSRPLMRLPQQFVRPNRRPAFHTAAEATCRRNVRCRQSMPVG